MPARETYTVAIDAKTQGAIRGLNNLNTALKATIAFFGARAVIDFGQQIISVTKDFERMNNQLRLVTGSQKELDATFKTLTLAAQNNRTSLADTMDLFTKLAVSTEHLGISQDRLVGVTGKLSRALQLAGADGNTASSVIRQFGQAMASGEVRGDEFRSLVEGLGPALSIMARESGITVGELRKMSQAGELTAETMLKIFENSTALDEAFGKLQKTTQNLETDFQDAFSFALNTIAESTGIAETYKETLVALTHVLDSISGRETPRNMDNEELFMNMGVPTPEKIEIFEERIKSLNRTLTGTHARAAGLPEGSVISVEPETTKLLEGYIEQLEEIDRMNKLKSDTDKKAAEAQRELDDAISDTLETSQEYIKAAEKLKLTDVRTQIEKLNDEYEEMDKLYKALSAAAVNLALQHGTENEEYQKLQELIGKVNIEKSTLIKLIEEEEKAIKDKEEEAKKARLAEIKHYDDAILRRKRVQQADAEAHFEKMVAAKKEAEELTEEQKSLAEFEKKTTAEKTAFVIAQGVKGFEALGKFNKDAFRLYKAFAIAQAIQNTALAATQALGRYPPPFSFIAAAAQVAAGVAQVATIRAQTYSGRMGGGRVEKGQPYIVGEGGREMFVPDSDGRIVSNSQMNSMGQPVNINFQIEATDPDGFDTLLIQRKNTIVSMVRQALQQGRLA